MRYDDASISFHAAVSCFVSDVVFGVGVDIQVLMKN
jgi:hypothetical protein